MGRLFSRAYRQTTLKPNQNSQYRRVGCAQTNQLQKWLDFDNIIIILYGIQMVLFYECWSVSHFERVFVRKKDEHDVCCLGVGGMSRSLLEMAKLNALEQQWFGSALIQFNKISPIRSQIYTIRTFNVSVFIANIFHNRHKSCAI